MPSRDRPLNTWWGRRAYQSCRCAPPDTLVVFSRGRTRRLGTVGLPSQTRAPNLRSSTLPAGWTWAGSAASARHRQARQQRRPPNSRRACRQTAAAHVCMRIRKKPQRPVELFPAGLESASDPLWEARPRADLPRDGDLPRQSRRGGAPTNARGRSRVRAKGLLGGARPLPQQFPWLSNVLVCPYQARAWYGCRCQRPWDARGSVASAVDTLGRNLAHRYAQLRTGKHACGADTSG